MIEQLSRRALISTLPGSAAALLLRNPTEASAQSAVFAVIQELEGWQGWEASDIACCKAYATYRLRQALGLEMGNRQLAQDHVQFQRHKWDAYAKSLRREFDLQDGRVYSPPTGDLNL